jgi:hypothetical protein
MLKINDMIVYLKNEIITDKWACIDCRKAFIINENGDLIYQRTTNVAVDFFLKDGDLYVRANG